MIPIPATVSGRPVGKRGVHLQPFGYHNYWMQDAERWVGLLQSMSMSWCLALTESDNLRISGAAEALLDGGVIPIVRFAYKFPDPWTHADEVGRLAELYARYNAPLVVQFANEPFDDREWEDGDVPSNAWEIIRDRWNQASREIADHGGYPGFPDGPGYSHNPFAIIGDPSHLWQDGRAIYLSHCYGSGRPLDYPYDDVSQNGTPLTMEEYRAALDDYADDPQWNEGPVVLQQMNEQRRAWAEPGETIWDDDTCWLGWQKTVAWSKETFGFVVPMAVGEGGWTPRDRAGSGPVDIRWPYTTPKMVAKKTLQVFQEETPFFAICPWLLASEDMGGVGWPDNCWVGWAFSDKYGREKPVIQALQATEPVSPVKALLGGARADIAAAQRALVQI